MRSTIIALAVAAMICACDGSKRGARSPSPATTVSRCGPSEENCTTEQVIAAVEYYYEVGGKATAAEAACLAPITARGTNAVNQAFDRVSAAQTRSAIACVGSEDRLRGISTLLASWFTTHPNG